MDEESLTSLTDPLTGKKYNSQNGARRLDSNVVSDCHYYCSFIDRQQFSRRLLQTSLILVERGYRALVRGFEGSLVLLSVSESEFQGFEVEKDLTLTAPQQRSFFLLLPSFEQHHHPSYPHSLYLVVVDL